ncbi:MAG: prefoldin subunit alpha [Euryarchaeota archaeon]|nr:prefoldin subunit alpha [Euryarchaeota archaeon]
MEDNQRMEAFAVLEELKSQFQALEGQHDYLQQVVADLARAKRTLEAVKSDADMEDLLVPVGGGNFVRASVTNKDKVISALGSGVSVEEGLEGSLARVDERLQAAERASDRLRMEMERVAQQLDQLGAALQG